VLVGKNKAEPTKINKTRGLYLADKPWVLEVAEFFRHLVLLTLVCWGI